MKGLKPFLSLAVGLLTCAVMIGCAGSIPKNGPLPLNIAQFTVNNGVIGIPYEFLLVASGGVKPFTWTITTGQLPPGLSLNTDGVISGTPTTLGKYQFTAKVVDSQTPTAAYNTVTATITINSVLGLPATTLPSATVGAPYNATVTASNGLPPYSYTPVPSDGSALPSGIKLNTTIGQNGAPNVGTFSGTPDTAGVYSFTVQVNDAANETATAVYTIDVIGRLQGSYVLYMNGFKNGLPFYDVAQLVASHDVSGSGQIDGTLDESGPGGTPASGETVSGTYTVGNHTNFGTLSFQRKDNGVTYTFSMVVSTAGTTKVILNSTSDAPNGHGSGLLKTQSATTLPGTPTDYAFGLFGNDAGGNRYAGIGMFALGNSNGGLQTVTGGEEDINDNGSMNNGNGLSQPISITSGLLTPLDPTTGRGTLTLTTSSGTLNYVYYVTSATELVAIDTDASGPATLVDILQQQVAGAGGGFGAGSLKGQSVIQLSGVDSSTVVPTAAIGVVSFDGAGNIANANVDGYYTDQNDGGVVTPVQYATGTYSVDATCGTIAQPCGRVTVSLSGAPAQPVWYLSGANQAFVLDSSSAVMYGSYVSQLTAPTPANPMTPPFSNGSIVGYYLGVTLNPMLRSVTNELDVSLTPCCGGTWLQTYDSSGPGGIVNQATFTGPYNCGATFPTCDSLGDYLGRFIVTEPAKDGGANIEIIYVLGSGAGTTGAKNGLFGMNVGQQGDGSPDPNPRITTYSK